MIKRPKERPSLRQTVQHMGRPDDKRRMAESVVGAILMLSGLGMLAYHKHWEPLIPTILGAAFFDRRIVTDLVKAWRKGGTDTPGDG